MSHAGSTINAPAKSNVRLNSLNRIFIEETLTFKGKPASQKESIIDCFFDKFSSVFVSQFTIRVYFSAVYFRMTDFYRFVSVR